MRQVTEYFIDSWFITFYFGIISIIPKFGEISSFKIHFYGHMSNILMNAFVSFTNCLAEMTLPRGNNYQAAF